ncbi:hypothetical protein KPL71_021603 [Citrus sinensis]|uniref:Uncharacterized protein n=1 Tax=Citrus sinensis TaxID=2711 RepID=A0ACB8JGT5_CITSI|nr:hypothetical protein KPL71_021603 [Citrus sinensis]
MDTNTSSTSTSSSSHISLSSTLSLPKSCSKHIASKIENLVKYSYIPESAQINESQFPIMSPYNLYKQKTSFTRSIRTLISTKRPIPKEYIQSSRLDQCALQASQSEQYVTMEIPSDLVANWKREGYTHFHLGGVRLILTLHGRKGLPVTARITLLDTRFKEYQHAVIGTVLTTLHAGSVLLTFYPNFNLSLEDPNLPTTLKVQIQLQGAEQTLTSKIATLHHQIVYRLQNHALDLPTPYTTSDALMILADTDTIPTIIQIPKQIHKQDLLKLMPLEWLTNYEHFHQNSELVQTTEATFARRPNGQVKLSFQTPDTKPVSDSPQLSYTVMITAVQTGQEKKLPIHGFSSEGYPVYPDKINGHFLWDVPEAHMCNPNCPCLDDTDIDEELEVMRRKKKNHSYEESFPPLEKQTDTQTRVTSKPFIQSPVTASGQPEEPKQYEAILNWQTKNANAQNYTLHQLGKKIDRVATQVSQTETKVDSISSRLDQMYLHLQDRISELDADLRRMINNHIWGPEFNKKEAEIRKLKAELSRIDAEKARPSLFTQPQPTPVSPPIFNTYAPFYTPFRPQQPVYNQFFGFSHLQPTPQPSSPKKSRSKIQSSDSSYSSEPETNHSSSSSSCASSQASTDSESEYADITGILMATETADPSASTSTPIVDDNPSDQTSQTDRVPPPVHEHLTKPSSASWFTFDDIPRHKWAARHQEFTAWIDLQGTKPNAQPQAVLREFMAHSTGSLRDWLESLGEFDSSNSWNLRLIVASKLPDKDLLIGFDILHLVKNLFLTSSGVRYRQMFLPYIDTLRLYTLSETPSPYSHISQKFLEFCPENHSQFHHPSPLWKNEQFFIHLPFKLNEDINPTKASHPGMSPSNLLLAKQECSQLLQQGLIESTNSDWACQAFYVEKRSELVRGKKRLVIDYQPLNSFLKDDKFPLPKIQTLFVHLQGARIFSKFDLKADFWQLGISPVDCHKTAFCILDAHYQWTVMPFGLKVAPSLFQKAMTKIFSPILHHALVYIDDILLFSSDHESHQKLLLDFFHIVQAHGIILSEKKSNIGKESIDFLGMVIKDGQYQPGPHIAIELLKFPDAHLNRKQIQQFLGIVNYIRDFIPKVAIHTSQLSRMLKKQCPPWGPAQTEAVKQLKMIAQSPPPLRIPTGGQRILQTDASEFFLSTWIILLFPESLTSRTNCYLTSNYSASKPGLLSLTLSSLSISEDELWYMWCLTTLYATKLVFPIRPVLTHLTTPEFSPDLLWTLFEWPYFQHPETRDYWTQDMAYEWRTYPHPYTLIHDTSVSSVLKAYLMELNNVPPPAINIHHTSIGPSHTLEDPWEDFQSLLHTENPHYTVTTPASPAASTSQPMTEADEAKYQQAEAYLDQRQRHWHKRQYEKATGDVSPSRYPSTP